MGEYLQGLIAGVVQGFLAIRKDEREKALAKIDALSELLIENKVYLRDYSNSQQRNQETETRLAREWQRVGTLFYTDSRELASFCEAKSGYWTHPDLYSKRKVEELGITIRSLEEQHRRIKEQLL